MQNHLANSTAAYPAGLAPGRRCFQVSSGPYAGRIAVIMAVSASRIKLIWADYPYTVWSLPTAVAEDSGDFPFDAVMDVSGHIYLAYTLNGTNDLGFRKLTFSEGVWVAGSTITVYSGDDNYYPSIIPEAAGRIWISFSRHSGGQYYVNAKFSDDDGGSWSGGVSGAGTALSSGAASAFSKMILRGNYLHALYSLDGTKIAGRKKHIYAATWESEEEIISGTGFDGDFDAAVSPQGKLGAVFDNGQLRFREFDGDAWGAVKEIDGGGVICPQVKYSGESPWVVYLLAAGGDQKQIMYSECREGAFLSPGIVEAGLGFLSKVLCYRALGGTYREVTSAAASDTAGDIFHADSGALVRDIGDSLYLGLDEKFDYLKLLLSAAGSGGTVSWQYFDGLEWCAFVPSGGDYHLTLGDRELRLWDDRFSVPGSWQKATVDGTVKFWIRAVVTSPYTTAPIGSQISTLPDLGALILME